MEIKSRDFPQLMLNTEALNKRLALHHRSKEYIDGLAGRLRAGYVGEKSIDFYLDFLSNDYRIFNFLRLPDSQGHFQMDTNITTSQFSLIIDVKNITGTIIFDGMGQCIRIKKDGVSENFNNPVNQIKLQQSRLQQWMKSFAIPPLPVIPLVVFSNSNAIIKDHTNNPDTPKVVIRRDNLLTKIEELSKQFTTDILSDEDIVRLGLLFVNKHTPENFDVLKKHDIHYHELIKGVFCPSCGAIPMIRKGATWICRRCGHKSKTAHIPALKDFMMLNGKMISNRQARDWLQIESEDIMRYLLKQLNLKWIGITSARKYILDFDEK